MAILDNIKRGDRISFSLVRSGIAGDTFNNVLVDTRSGYATAKAVTTDLNNKHANLFSYFRDKVDGVNDPGIYEYLIIKVNDLTEELVAIGIPWINESSVKISDTKTVRLELLEFEEYKRNSLITYLNNAKINHVFSDE